MIEPKPLDNLRKENHRRATSLVNKIRIKVCKLPKDFFRYSSVDKPNRPHSISSRSTREDICSPGTPSFGKKRED